MTNLHISSDLCLNKQMIYAELIPLCNKGKLNKDEVNKLQPLLLQRLLKSLLQRIQKI